MSNLYDPEVVGKLLGISVVTLHHWRKNGIGPEWFRRGGFYYYRAEQLQEYLHRIGPIPEGMNLAEKRRFFAEAHHPDVIPETPEPATAALAELAKRLAVVERTLAGLV